MPRVRARRDGGPAESRRVGRAPRERACDRRAPARECVRQESGAVAGLRPPLLLPPLLPPLRPVQSGITGRRRAASGTGHQARSRASVGALLAGALPTTAPPTTALPTTALLTTGHPTAGHPTTALPMAALPMAALLMAGRPRVVAMGMGTARGTAVGMTMGMARGMARAMARGDVPAVARRATRRATRRAAAPEACRRGTSAVTVEGVMWRIQTTGTALRW